MLPNLVVIGAQKCGTSALHYYLGLHPDIQMSSPKELRFFCDEAVVGPGAPAGWWRGGNWHQGLDWYAAQFSPRFEVRGESSPQYTSQGYPYVAERMAATLPDARLIYIVRDPIDRILSDYAMRFAEGFELQPPERVLAEDPNPYVERSRYHARLAPFLDHFERDQILVLSSEALLDRRRETMREAFRFLDVDPDFWSPRMERMRNTGSDSGALRRLLTRLPRGRLGHALTRALPQESKWWLERLFSRSSRNGAVTISSERRQAISDQLRDDVARLRRLTGMGFESWGI